MSSSEPEGPSHSTQPFSPPPTAAAPTPPPRQEDGTLQQITPSAAAMASSAQPAQIPGYEILGELGRGGMGVVYKARQISLNRIVALKMILSGSHAGEAELSRFRTEAEAVARLQHPNIVQIHEIGQHGGLPYFSLEFVDGGGLDRTLRGPGLAARPAARLAADLARAVHYAHSHGVVHRDLKPANVLLTAEGRPKITDFGLAKKMEGEPDGRTQTGAILGTPGYMAPEQAEGSKDVGPAADVYALGAILYELLTGRPPFRAATPMSTLAQVIRDEPTPPRRLRPQTPRDLESVCLKCLNKSPAGRYESAQALAEDLERWLCGAATRARSIGRAERLWRRARRNPAVSGLAAAVALLLCGVLALGLQNVFRTGAPAAPNAGPVEAPADDLLGTVAELDRTDPGWRLEQIEAKRTVLPAEQNAALRVQSARRLLPDHWPDAELANALPALSGRPREGPDIAFLRRSRDAAAPAVAEARPLADLRQGRYAISYSRDGLTTLLPHAEDARAVAVVLQLDALVRSGDGDPDGALASCRGVLDAGRSLGDEPMAISQLVRIACAGVAAQALQRTLAEGEPSGDGLAAMQGLLEDEAEQPLLLFMARGERGVMHWLLSAVESGDFPDPDLRAGAAARPAHVWLLKHGTRFVEIAKRPVEEQRALIEPWAEAARKEAPAGARRYLVAADKLVGAFQLHQARVRCAATAVAAERYRQAQGRWPDALADLAPALVREVPTDPYDGAALRYRRLDDGVVIYAVGPDLRDDNGALQDNPAGAQHADVGFRLWDAARRRRGAGDGGQPVPPGKDK